MALMLGVSQSRWMMILAVLPVCVSSKTAPASVSSRDCASVQVKVVGSTLPVQLE